MPIFCLDSGVLLFCRWPRLLLKLMQTAFEARNVDEKWLQNFPESSRSLFVGPKTPHTSHQIFRSELPAKSLDNLTDELLQCVQIQIFTFLGQSLPICSPCPTYPLWHLRIPKVVMRLMPEFIGSASWWYSSKTFKRKHRIFPELSGISLERVLLGGT